MERGNRGPVLESRSYRITQDVLLGGSMWLKVQVQVIFLTPNFRALYPLGYLCLFSDRTDLSSFLPNTRALEGNFIADSFFFFFVAPMEPSLGRMDNGTRKYLLLKSREDPRE